MKVALICGSPKRKNSASQALLADFKGYLPKDAVLEEHTLNKPEVDQETIEKLKEADALIFAFPLYVDGVPSHLLACLGQLEQAGLGNKRVACMVNCGFYEGRQNRLAIQIMKNWCKRAGCLWTMGIGFGGGGALAFMGNCPPGKGLKKSLGQAMEKLAAALFQGEPAEDAYISIGFPRVLYKLSGQMGWKKSIKANGGRPRDLNRRM